MIFYCIGVDHKNTGLSLREALYSRRAEAVRFWESKSQAVEILSTCNRIEIYGIFRNAETLYKHLTLFKKTFYPLFQKAYFKLGVDEVLRQALLVASGLESQVLGEFQIFEQINSWIARENFSPTIKMFWLKVLPTAALIRQQSGLIKKRNKLSEIIFDDLVLRSDSNSIKKVLIVGTGKVAQGFSDSRPRDSELSFFARKNIKKAKKLARSISARAFLLNNLASELRDATALISATASPHQILTKQFLEKIVRTVKKPLYIYDLAVPRDVDPLVRGLPGIVLKDNDDLNFMVKAGNQNLSFDVDFARRLVEEYVLVRKGDFGEQTNNSRIPAESLSFATS